MTTPKTDPYWWEDFTPDAGQAPELPAESEVVVVGAGLTGCSAARTLAKSGADVVVLDAQRPGFGASTRNGGMIGGGYRLSLEQMTKRYGTETTHALLRESHIDSLEFATSLIRDEAITCDFHTYGRFRGQWNKAEYDATARSLDRLRELVPVNIEMIPPERQRQEVGTGLYCGAMLLHDHGGLHPAKYLNGMLAAARRAGARIVWPHTGSCRHAVRIGVSSRHRQGVGTQRSGIDGDQRLYDAGFFRTEKAYHPGIKFRYSDRRAAAGHYRCDHAGPAYGCRNPAPPLLLPPVTRPKTIYHRRPCRPVRCAPIQRDTCPARPYE